MTERLRELLELAVPDDAPVFEPHTLAATARRRRNRGRAVTAGLAAVVLVVAGAIALAGTRGDDRDHVAHDPDPYSMAPCPSRLPDLAAGVYEVDSLAGAVAMRWCPDPGPAPTTGTRTELTTMDALIDPDALTTLREAVAEFAGEHCGPASTAVADRRSLQIAYADGRTVLLAAGVCSRVLVDGADIDGGILQMAYLRALDQQRNDLAYTRAYDGPLECVPSQVPNVAQPGRELIVRGGVCHVGDTEATPLTETQLRRIADAWDHPGIRTDEECVIEGTEPTLVLTTNRGDVIRLQDDGCAQPRLAFHGMGGASLSLSMGDLGITP
ncbi:hypothetical protein [Nocardioides nitrophenolicus]|uniref:hypothetical protein n=1 Tax=Nocardioides nitrophenolicus TaxID=60489 RepID=UPI00195926EF|nr:hypothetical protein [Nocardioides nitrophenolicus]MBM7516103.1 hypothetical protein [Nocardioides nitrophenolicus]